MDWGMFAASAAAVIFISYLIGAVPFGFIIGKSKGIDIREHGSGNIGATNVTRVVGKKAGKLCFFLDFLKGALPVALTLFLTERAIIKDWEGLLPVLSALAVVAGHIWPVYLKFRGGKGVATAAGAVLPLSPYAVLIALITWVVVFKSSKYVSLASIIAAVVLPLGAIVLKLVGVSCAGRPAIILFVVLGALTVIKHKSNIKRLLDGTENRFSKEKK